ncbi:unnamed protein product [Rotaria sp. Silwood1]|nr:unnamed protein product [Rotaria sp. Silwood1]
MFQSSHSIDEVRENTEFYWRYQRYSFVREYFECLPLSYPPLIFISHIILLFLTIRSVCYSMFGRSQVASENNVPLSKKFTRIFKMIPMHGSQNEQWDSFENAATHSYIRSILEKSKNQDTLTTNHGKPHAWILTAGIDNGISKLVGEGISHYRLLQEYPNKVKCIGMTMWGTINEDTRLELKSVSSGFPTPLCKQQIPDNTQEYKETIERNHTHCTLFDSGRLNEYLGDSQRHEFVIEACKDTDNDHICFGVTIIVEGGFGSLEVLENDIKEKRPIVLIQGSGRLADALAMLIEQTSNSDRNQYR